MLYLCYILTGDFVEKYDVKFKKKFGQNFLRDNSVVLKIVNLCNITKNDLVIEVGPGGAILTRELSKVAKNVLAYEIDEDLKNELSKKLSQSENVDVIYKDFLNSDIVSDIKKYDYDNVYFVSNVPYYITTPIVMKLINSDIKFKKICMMVQKEVADRFSTEAGNKSYGSITVLLNYYFDVNYEFFVPREEFIPAPNVDSAVISFVEKDTKLELKDKKFFERLVRDSFQFKRKNIRNNLKQYDLDKISLVLSKYGYDLSVRAEQLDIEIFVELANSLI
ncbi:MAG: ribosomal RNA small subunit methyltransferase A [Firmicutes bacterium]|nr:ribosomal RNA small subunit methyltransferase A [Bacillota bacterium]